MNVERLLEPIPNGSPTGPDLDRTYDPEFVALEVAAQGKPEQQYGDRKFPAVPPDWRVVREKSEALLLRSKDLRIAVLLARALTHLEHIEGAAAGLQLISGLVSRYWDGVHPALDDDNDASIRLRALSALAHPEAFLQDVREACFVALPQVGRVSIRDLLVAEGKLKGANGANLTPAQIAGIARTAAAEQPQSLRAAIAGFESLKALEAFLNGQGLLTHEAAPDLKALRELLQPVAAVSSQALDGAQTAAPAPESPAETAAGPSPAKESPTMLQPGQIASREDVIRILDRVCEYMERTEPSSPAPLLIRRAQRLMSRNFLEIIQDLAPGGLSDIQKLAGPEQK